MVYRKPILGFLLLFAWLCVGTLSVWAAGPQDAAQWLLTQQQTNGSWGGSKSSAGALETTSVVLEALVVAGKGTGTPITQAWTYLSGTKPTTTSEWARRIIAASMTGQTPPSSDLTNMLALQRTNGGFAPSAGHQTTVIDTALAVLALSLSRNQALDAARNGVSYLLSEQRKDGSYGFFDTNNDPSVYLTGLVMMAVGEYKNLYNVTSAMTNAVNFLKGKQATDGSWGTGRDKLLDTSLGVLGLMASGQSVNALVSAASKFLTAQQAQDGSFASGDPYTTAYALRAMDSERPDLSISSQNITASPQILLVGGEYQIQCKIKNEGTKAAQSVVVRLYLGDPASSGQKVDEVTISTLDVGADSTQTLRWKDAKPAGSHYLYIVVDPDKTITELNERNNTAVWGVRVYPPVDFEITSNDIVLKPTFPAPNQPLEITAIVHNKGGIDASQVEVAFYDADPTSGGKQIGSTQTIASIKAGLFETAMITTPPLSQGSKTVYVVVDPSNLKKDTNLANNKAKKDFSVQPRVDLLVTSQGIFFSKSEVPEGEKIEIRIGVYNAEATTATDAVVRVYDGNPSSGGKQIGTDTKVTVPGYQAVYTPAIIFDTFGKNGTYTLYVVVDPDRKFPDTDFNNNIALRSVKVIGLPDLSISAAGITFSPTTPNESGSLTVYAQIENKGYSASQTGTKVLFYDTDPNLPGATPAYSTTIGVVNPNANTRPTMSWSPIQKVGTRTFWVVIDPDKTSPDRDRNNNTASQQITVNDSTYPDLLITSDDISFVPTKPQAGTTMTLQARVHSRYRQLVSNVLVRFHNGSPTTTNQIGETVLAQVPGYGNALASVNWAVPATQSPTTIYVVVNPSNTIRETTTGNNTASRYIEFALGQNTTPTNFTVAAQNQTELKFQWQAGSGAAAAGVNGYHIYCNGGLLNPPTAITGVTAKASSELNTTQTAAKTVDETTSTYWEPSTKASEWVEWTLPQQEEVSVILLYFFSTYSRTFMLQAWVNNQWTTLQSLTATTQELHQFLLPTPVISDRFRVIYTPTTQTYFMRIRDIRLYRSGLAKGTTYTKTGMFRGKYTCHAVGVTSPMLFTPSSNQASANIEDVTPPSAPSGVTATYNPSAFENRVSWTPPTDTDLAGHLMYSNQGVDVALFSRGAQVYAPGISNYNYYFIDGGTSATANITSPDHAVVTLAQTYSLYQINVHLSTSGNHNYLLETSTDGQNYTSVGTRTDINGKQEHLFAQPRSVRYIRITPQGIPGTALPLAEIEALTRDLALSNVHGVSYLRRILTSSTGTSFWNSYWKGYVYDYKLSTAAPRQFILRDVYLSPLDVMLIEDSDTGQVLARVSGQHQLWVSDWLLAKNYRFRIDHVNDGPAFNIETVLTRTFQTASPYVHANVYENGTYQYAVSAVDQQGNESALSSSANAVVNDTSPPTAPTGLKATAGNKQVQLSWAITYIRDRKGYIIYRNGTKIAESATTSYTDTNVVNGTTYSYEVSSVDFNNNETAKAGPVTATPTAIDFSFSQQGAFADLFVSPQNPSVYESAVLIVMVRNIGLQDSNSGVDVDLYDGDPKASGTKIGTITLSQSIAAGAGAIGSFEWKLAQVKPGKRTVYAIIDPANKISELNETNNTATIDLTVHADYYLSTFVNKVESGTFPVVDLFMSVRSANGGGIFGLDERNFKVWEDGTREIPITVKQLTQPTQDIPKADVVFVIDTSGSMNDEWQTICKVIDDIRDLLLASRIDAQITIYGLATDYQCGKKLGTAIWRGQPKTAASEDWGPGSSWVVLNHTWRTGAVRVVIPISDEGAYNGSPWSAEDTEAVDEMIKLAKSTNPPAIYYPFWGSEVPDTDTIAKEMSRAAKDTGGEAFAFKNATQVVQAIVRGVMRSISDYQITYTTHNKAKDGTLRKVKVETTYNISKGEAEGEYRAPLDNLPELFFEGSITATPDPPVPGQVGTLSATVKNQGGKPAIDIVVRWYLGEPGQGGLLFAESKIPKLDPSQTQAITVSWRGLAGNRKIVVVIDPDNQIQESNETNNRIETELKLPGSAGTDLATNTFALSITPFPAVKGQSVQIAAQVYNVGQNDASNVLVSFFRGDPKQGGETLGTVTLPQVGKGQAAEAKLTHILKQDGDFELYVIIDPYDTIAESDEDNNAANKTFRIDTRDLALSVATDKPSYPANTEVKISVKLKNQTEKPWNGRGEVWVVDKDQKPVEKVSDFTAQDIPSVGIKGWPYRIPVDWTAPTGGTQHFFLGLNVNFTQALQDVNQGGKTLDEKAIRVARFDTQTQSVSLVPFAFQKAQGYDAITKAQGVLVVFLKEAVAAGSKIRFYVFFDVVGGNSPTSPKTLDFPKTGWQLAYMDDAGNLYLRERLANGSWGTEVSVGDISTSSDNSRGVALGDFNRDGVTDLITASGANHKLYFYPGSTTDPKKFDVANRKEVGTLSTTTTTVQSIVVGDLNNDGVLDVVVSRYYNIDVFLGNGDGTFQVPKTFRTTSTSYYPFGKVLVDYDGDGNLDLITTVHNVGIVFLLKGDGKGNLGTATPLFTAAVTYAYGLAVADFDNDGFLDILVNNTTTGDALFYGNDGKGGWKTAVPVPSLDTNNYTSWAMGDWDYDGKIDLFATTNTAQNILLFTGNGLSFTASTPLNTAKLSFTGISVAPPVAHEFVTVGKAEGSPEQTWNFTWNTKVTPSGAYHVRVQLFETAGVVAEASTPFAIEPEIKAKAELTTDRLAYPGNAPVVFLSRVFNESVNTTYEQLQGTILIEDAQNKQVTALSFTMTNVIIGRFLDQTSGWNTGTQAPGKYTAKLSVSYQNKEIATASTSFDILTSAESGIGLLGTLRVNPGLVKVGESTTLTYEVTNIGNQTFTNHEIKVRIFSDADRQEKDSLSEIINLDVQKTQSFSKAYDTTKLGKGDYTLMLTTKLGTQELSLDAAILQVREEVQRPPLTVKITLPTQGTQVPSPVIAVSGDVADGDAQVVVNGIATQVTGAPAQASTFAATRINLSSCEAVIEAKATRGTDTASDTITVAVPHQSVVLMSKTAVQNQTKQPGGIAIGANQSLVLTDPDKGTIIRLTLDNQQKVTQETEVAKDLTDPGAVYEDSNGHLYVAETSKNQVIRIEKGGNKQTWITATDGLVQPAAFAGDGKGGLFIASSGNGKVYLIDASQKIEVYAEGLQQPVGLAYDSKLNYLYIVDKSDGQVYRVNQKGDKPTSVASSLPGQAGGMALIGSWLVLADQKDNALYLANVDTGKVQIIAGLLQGPTSLIATGTETFALVSSSEGIVYGKLAQLKCRDDEPTSESATEPQEETVQDAQDPELQFEKNQISDKSQTGDLSSGEQTVTEEPAENLLPPGGCNCEAQPTVLAAGPLSLLLLAMLGLVWFVVRRRNKKRPLS